MKSMTLEQAFERARQFDSSLEFEAFRHGWNAMTPADREDLCASLVAPPGEDEFDLDSDLEAAANGDVDRELVKRMKSVRQRSVPTRKS